MKTLQSLQPHDQLVLLHHSFERLRHCGVFANLADENSLIIFYIPNSSTFPSFNLFEGLFHSIEDYKTICFNPFRTAKGESCTTHMEGCIHSSLDKFSF